ncbi:FMNH2-dependent alkanesulfonate monooxygenase [Deinococcus misasensis]|uniref:FMNH2-dependent alkanesulfonate monooxygenase n=1 Tax=Deinococcus misasensis TaxID=392413 RepID=UPI00068FC74C|nr:FMNH2-dependent alkanesulfonate monooxygenase [Deinococcus misasensis]
MTQHSTPDIFWFIPTSGDGRHLGSHNQQRTNTFDYLKSVAIAADTLGFDGALLPTGYGCEESWVTASALASLTRRLKFLVAVRPGLISPALAARMTAALDRISGGRVSLNLVSGAGDKALLAEGLPEQYLDKDARYQLTREWVHIFRALLEGQKVTYQGEHLQITDGQLQFGPVQQPLPPVYFGGSSEPAIQVAADYTDVYLTWGEPPHIAREKIERVSEQAALAGRKVRFGVRAHIIIRETEEEAWREADRLIEKLDDASIHKAQQQLSQSDSTGQQRMLSLHGGDRNKLTIYKNLWAGVGLVRAGAGTAFVGNPENIARLIQEYQDIGVDTFVLSGYPHLEEAYRTAELLFPVIGKTQTGVLKVQETERRVAVSY